jgi:hypothetical protein
LRTALVHDGLRPLAKSKGSKSKADWRVQFRSLGLILEPTDIVADGSAMGGE